MERQQLKRQVDEMSNIAGKIGDLNNLPLTPENRHKVGEVVREAIAYGFTQRVQEGRIVLFWGCGPLSEVVTIGMVDDTIWANPDRLWGTICGLNEQVQEMAAY